MVYDVTMLEAFYAAYKGKVKYVTGYTETPFDAWPNKFCMLICMM